MQNVGWARECRETIRWWIVPESNYGLRGRPSGAPIGRSSTFTALTRQVHELGLMRRRYGYYWTKLIGAVVVLTAWVAAFLWIGDTWWQLASGARPGGDHDPGGVPRP